MTDKNEDTGQSIPLHRGEFRGQGEFRGHLTYLSFQDQAEFEPSTQSPFQAVNEKSSPIGRTLRITLAIHAMQKANQTWWLFRGGLGFVQTRTLERQVSDHSPLAIDRKIPSHGL